MHPIKQIQLGHDIEGREHILQIKIDIAGAFPLLGLDCQCILSRENVVAAKCSISWTKPALHALVFFFLLPACSPLNCAFPSCQADIRDLFLVESNYLFSSWERQGRHFDIFGGFSPYQEDWIKPRVLCSFHLLPEQVSEGRRENVFMRLYFQQYIFVSFDSRRMLFVNQTSNV